MKYQGLDTISFRLIIIDETVDEPQSPGKTRDLCIESIFGTIFGIQ
jgi:hypothetical protein